MSIILSNEEYFAHYGTKGMRWGVRKARKAGGAAKKAGKYAVKYQLGQTKGQKQARVEAKATIKRAGGAAKKAGKYAIKYQLGQTEGQKQARGEARATIVRAKKALQTKVSALNTQRNRDAVKAGGIITANLVSMAALYQVSTHLPGR